MSVPWYIFNEILRIMWKKGVAYYKEVKPKIKWYRRRIVLLGMFIFFLWYLNCLPEVLFRDSTSTVLLDSKGELLGARISDDEQWRFEECDSVPYKFKTCLIQFEDRNFYGHFGFSMRGLGRAIVQNFQSGKKRSGGSTLTMQLVRLIRKNPERSYIEKILEIIRATRLEMKLTKEEILRLYSSHAPFGGNVVGLDAASWRYYGRPPHLLSWSESATLAVLPNAPGLIFPGKNHDRLKKKRDRLLKRLYDVGVIDAITYDIALLEPLPDRPLPLPNDAPHLLDQLIAEGKKGQSISLSIVKSVQCDVNRQLDDHLETLQENKVFNGAVVVTSVKTGKVVAYIGNSLVAGEANANRVNCINGRRSTGSILKPLLYMKALDDGLITPQMLLLDVPSKFGSFAPKNFAGNFDGLVPANQALSRSLNIPLVHLLKQYGIGRFHSDLREFGLTTINAPADHYGLSLILGGAEVNLYELCSVYTRLAQKLAGTEEKEITYYNALDITANELRISKAAIFSTFEALLEVKRPDEDGNWQLFSSSRKIAWKTGTSFGFRDAWAVGVSPDYVVAVWVGNADGEGRPGLTGSAAAAPLLFDIFDNLPHKTSWFDEPFGEMQTVELCSESGQRSTQYCERKVRAKIPVTTLKTRGCPYHQLIHLDSEEKNRVDSDCYSPEDMKHKSCFLIPSGIEEYYKRNHPEYKSLPQFRKDCIAAASDPSFSVYYPRMNQKIYLPVDFNAQRRTVIFEAISRSRDGVLFWHLDEVYVGQSATIHQLELSPEPGKHKLKIVDENGYSEQVFFEVLQ